jgi:hypothetical protein
MNKTLSTLMGASVLATGLIGAVNVEKAAAFGVDFTLNSYTITANDTDPGLVVETQQILTTPYSFTLDEGEMTGYINLFDIWTDETTVNNGEDTVAKPISVAFDFTAPPPPFGGDATGSTNGVRSGIFGFVQNGEVTWNNPLILNYGEGGSGKLKIELTNTIFNKGVFGLNEGEQYGGTVQVKFTNHTSPVPEPLTLLGSGIALGFGGYMKRKLDQSKKA